MKKQMLGMLGAAAFALGACGDSDRTRAVEEPPLVTSGSEDEALGRPFELRLRGENPEGYEAALVPIRSLRVTTPEGVELPVRLQARTVDVTAENHAHLVGRFYVPAGVERVRVALAFDAFGGWEGAEGAGAIDTRVAPLVFDAPLDALSARGRAVVHLDVGRSLKSEAGNRRALRPAMSVHY